MKVVCQAVILDDAPVFRLVLGDDTVGTIVDSLHQVLRFATLRVLCTMRIDDAARHAQADGTVDASLTAMVVLIISVQGMNCVFWRTVNTDSDLS